MNFASLGPPIPGNMIRLPAFHLSRWSLIPECNSEGEVCLNFAGRARGYEEDVVLLIACERQTGNPIRCMMIRPDGRDLQHEMLPLEWLPGIVEDIARSAVLDHFVGRSLALWHSQPTPRA